MPDVSIGPRKSSTQEARGHNWASHHVLPAVYGKPVPRQQILPAKQHSGPAETAGGARQKPVVSLSFTCAPRRVSCRGRKWVIPPPSSSLCGRCGGKECLRTQC